MIGVTTLLAESGFGDHMGDWGGGWWILMMFLMVVFWALLILGVVWLARSVGSGSHPHSGQSAIELLDHRLARGEISPDEYRERRDTLTGDTTSSGSGDG